MKKAVVLILVFISLVMLVLRFGTKGMETFLGIKQQGGISILSTPKEAQVFIDGKEVGKTPYEDRFLEVKEYTVKLEKGDLVWQGKIQVSSGTLAVVNRELALDPASQAGETLTLEKGKGVTVISTPSEAQIEIDGQVFGKTPLHLNISDGEHTFNLQRAGFLKRNIRALLPEGYQLALSVDLALSEAEVTNIQTPVIKETPKVIIKETPTNFLRVRDKPSLSGKEIAQVKPGEELIMLEELSGWYRVRLSNGTEGYVSSTYVEKKT